MNELTPGLIAAKLPAAAKTLFVAYSGGVDSTVLLHLCASDPELRRKSVAVYVHHGLQRDADAWAEHCRRIAGHLGVGFQELRVDAKPRKRQSPEEAAREARYAALRRVVRRKDVLLVAQHAEDQLETVLLQLFRGAGVFGLAAMPESVSFGNGVLLRPMLALDKASILRYADAHGLDWVEDPSNRALDYDRNYLRNKIIPLLKERWPALDKTVSRSAGHCAEAAGLLSELADDLLARHCDRRDQSLSIESLTKLDAGRRNMLLRHWFAGNGLKPPGATVLQSVMRDVAGARADADPELRCQGRLIKRYRGRLYCLPGNSLLPDSILSWPKEVDSLSLNNGFRLRATAAQSGLPLRFWEAAEVTVGFRQGGEMLRLPGRAGRHSLKKLFQEEAVPPWLRKVVPLIYLDGQLAAVAGYWLAAEFYSDAEPCLRIWWEPDSD